MDKTKRDMDKTKKERRHARILAQYYAARRRLLMLSSVSTGKAGIFGRKPYGLMPPPARTSTLAADRSHPPA